MPLRCVKRVCALHYLVEVLVEPIHEKQQQLLGVLLIIARKLLINLAYGDLEVPWADALVQTSPQGFHDHTKLLCHLPFMAKDVLPDRWRTERRCEILPLYLNLYGKSFLLFWPSPIDVLQVEIVVKVLSHGGGVTQTL